MKPIPILIFLNLLLVGLVTVFFLSSFNNKALFSSLETKKLTIRNDSGKAYIQMGFEGKEPSIFVSDEEGNSRIHILGGKSPSITIKDKQNRVIAQLSTMKDGSGSILLHDTNGVKRMHLQGGETPGFYLMNQKDQVIANLTQTPEDNAILLLRDNKENPTLLLEGGNTPGFYLRNNKNQTIGSWTVLNEGGTGIGLADNSGLAATILRGGPNPGVAFFASKNDPSAAFGLSSEVPHLHISGPKGNECILLHGGSPTGLMLVDESGSVKIFISKEGVFKEKQKNEQNPQKDKFFTLKEDSKVLFPDSNKVAQ